VSSQSADTRLDIMLIRFRRFGFETVDLHVGPASGGKVFRVHKKFLCDKIPYFSKMFNGGFVEAKNNTASFPEDSPEAFDLLIEWVYTGVLRQHTYGAASVENWEFISFYTLAEKLCLPQLQDTAMDMMQASQLREGIILSILGMTLAYEKTQVGSGYRLYTLHSLFYSLGILRTDKELLKAWSNEGVAKMLNKCPDLAVDCLSMIRTHFSQTPLKMPMDPRMENACIFHSHKIDEQCLLKPKTVEAEENISVRLGLVDDRLYNNQRNCYGDVEAWLRHSSMWAHVLTKRFAGGSDG
jgi:hypothetical protein